MKEQLYTLKFKFFKATVSFGVPFLVQLLTWLQVSDYRNILNTER